MTEQTEGIPQTHSAIDSTAIALLDNLAAHYREAYGYELMTGWGDPGTEMNLDLIREVSERIGSNGLERYWELIRLLAQQVEWEAP